MAAAPLSSGAPLTGRRYDPLRTFQFRIGIFPAGSGTPGPYVGGVQRVSGLGATIEANETWEGGNNVHPYLNPNRITWDPITLDQGIALDSTLEDWARTVMAFVRTGKAPAGDGVKRNVVIDLWDPIAHTGAVPAETSDQPPIARVRRYLVLNAWVSRYVALPALDAMASAVGLVTVELKHEGWKLLDEAPGDLVPSA